MRNAHSVLARVAVTLIVGVAPLAAQAKSRAPAAAQKVTLDRNRIPDPGQPPALKVPAWTKTRLSNGAELLVSQKKGLPLVSVTVNFLGGSAQYEPAGKTGTASLTAQMLNEGTATRSGDDLSNAQQLLGTSITASVSPEYGRIGFRALTAKLEPALELMTDMIVNPSFPDAALQRRKAQTLVNLTQARDNPVSVAYNVFTKVNFGDEHPYGRVVTPASINAITRDDIVAFHRAYFQPGRAVVTVVGDVDPAQVQSALDKAFAAWPAGGDRPSFQYPPLPASRGTTIYLVDKPKAAQSVVFAGLPGPSRDNPDVYALEVMNTILGDLFQSRLNRVIREEKGYSYGVNSTFGFVVYPHGPGAFRAGGSIHTVKTDSALVELMKQLRGVQGEQPFTEDEIKQGKESLIQGLPAMFSSVASVASAISGIYLQGLPENYYQEYASRINAVTPDDLVRVAKKYIDLSKLSIVVVGDRAAIEEPLRKTGIGPVVLLDADARPVPATP